MARAPGLGTTGKVGTGGELWIRPTVVTAVSSFHVTQVTLSAATAKIIAPANPERFGLLFVQNNNAANGMIAWPVGGSAAAAISKAWGGIPPYLDLGTYGPLVTAEWWGLDLGAGSVHVWEVFRLGC